MARPRIYLTPEAAREAQRENNRRYRQAHPDLLRERSKASYDFRDQKNRGLKRKYGITLVEFEAMTIAQEGRCAICHEEPGMPPRGTSPTLYVDHDHDTGSVRGLLCHDCNRALGGFKDDPVRLRAAADYLLGK